MAFRFTIRIFIGKWSYFAQFNKLYVVLWQVSDDVGSVAEWPHSVTNTACVCECVSVCIFAWVSELQCEQQRVCVCDE